MKRYALFLPLLACAALLSGCVLDGPPVVSGGAYPGYYGRGYYNETPPGPVYDVAPYYGGGGVAVIETGGYRDREYRNDRDRDGRRNSRYGRDGNRSGGSYNRGGGPNGVRRTSGLNRPNAGRGKFQRPNASQNSRGGARSSRGPRAGDEPKQQ